MNQKSCPPSSLNQSMDTEAIFLQAVAAQDSGALEQALRLYGRCLNLSFRHGPTCQRIQPLAASYRLEAEEAERVGDLARALDLYVRAVELDPFVEELAASVRRLASRIYQRDLTNQCFAYYDETRARAIHGEAIHRVIDYVTLGGIVGDVFEFGVLGGWSARIIAETMRGVYNLNDIYLFDSFDGLPREISDIDRHSYEVRRNIWPEWMKFGDNFIKALGEPLHQHIAKRLATVVRPERIHIRRGFFSDTLTQPLTTKAAVVHVDCDLYDSTIQVLEGLSHWNVFQDGCVLMFDDWNLNRANPDFGERRAFREFLESQNRFTATPFFSYGFNGSVFFLHEKLPMS